MKTLREDDLRHLLRRTCFAATAQQLRALRGCDLDRTLALIIADARGASLATQSGDPPEGDELPMEHQIENIRQLWLGEMIATATPLAENLTLFLHGLFGSSSAAVKSSEALRTRNALLRRNALGNFPDLLQELILDPAMMIQIGMDGHGLQRVSDRPAKLVLDRWTVGAGLYADRDVEDLSRALTGWAVPCAEHQRVLRARFDASQFDSGEKLVLGHAGALDAQSALQALALHPLTARRLTRQMCRHFGVSEPGTDLQTRLEAVYLAQQGSIRPLVMTLLESDDFWADRTRWTMIKSPVQLAVGACRQLRLASVPTAALSQWTADCGQLLYDTPDNGESDWIGQETWITLPDLLALRYSLPDVLLGTGTSTVRRGESGHDLKPRDLDPAPGFAAPPAGDSTASVIRWVMASPHYQLA